MHLFMKMSILNLKKAAVRWEICFQKKTNGNLVIIYSKGDKVTLNL